jgi:pleiotropic regulator 1
VNAVDDGLAKAYAARFPQAALAHGRNKIKLSTKLAAEYRDVQVLPPVLAGQQAGPAGPKRPGQAPAGPGAAGPSVKLIGGPEASAT